MPTTIKEGLEWATGQLVGVCERPQFEAELLLAYNLTQDRTYLITHQSDNLDNLEDFQKLIKRRVAHEPYEYIVGSASFYDIHLEVKDGVVIPRPETEMLIDMVADIIKKNSFSSETSRTRIR